MFGVNCIGTDAEWAEGAGLARRGAVPLEPDIIEALVRTIEIKDLCTAAHTWRVVLYSRLMGEKIGLDHRTMHRLSNAAALHDLGKIDIPDAILQKPSALTPEEFEIMKRHTVLGWERLRGMGEDDELLLSVVRHHHERVDGLGYPDGLKGEEIHLAARMFAVVDSFDAMTSVRPYHPQFGKEAAGHAMQTLKGDAGSHYCEKAVQLFSDAYDAGELDWILENFNDRVEVPTFAGADSVNALGSMRITPRSAGPRA